MNTTDAEMNWTKTPPTEPGKYYWREKPTMDWDTKTVFEDLTVYSDDLYDDRIVHVITLGGEWGGRVPAPGTTWTVEETAAYLEEHLDLQINIRNKNLEEAIRFIKNELCGLAATTERNRRTHERA